MLTIRRMRMEDVKAVADLEKEIFPDAWSDQAIEESLAQNHTMLIAAFDDKKLMGYLILYFVLEEGEIARIAVAPEYRRQGVGQKMLQEMEQLCGDRGITKLLLDVRESNEGAYTFYEDYGFEKDGIRKNFYTNPREDAILMSLDIY